MSFLVELPLHIYADHVFDDFTSDRDFRIGNARALMWTAQLAYEVRDAQDKIEPVLKRWGLAPVAMIGNGARRRPPFASTRGFVAEGRGATIVSFSGTDPAAFANWITNLDLGAPARAMHRGFHGAVDVVWKDVCAALSARNPAQPLFITGHSLGGALAIIAAERLRRECGIEANAVYAFGSPRVGSPAFARAYNTSGLGERTYRLVHGLDIVPSLPPSQFGFRHAGHMIKCKRGSRFTATESHSGCDSDDPPFFETLGRGIGQRWRDLASGDFLPSLRRGWLGHYQKYVLPPPLTDHLPERYRSAVEAAQDDGGGV